MCYQSRSFIRIVREQNECFWQKMKVKELFFSQYEAEARDG